ncbi:MAG: ECF transporter S component [Christensenellales bacterium]|jgi:hypothetical protein|nr:ECF transporter S component [Clostridiales bacterium]
MKKRLRLYYTVYDLILIAMLTALTIAFKALAGIFVRLITGPLGIPGGSLAGGLYMMWLPLGISIINKRGVAFIIALIQTLTLLITSLPGSHGIWTFLTYLTPAVLIEIVFFYKPKNGYNIMHFIVGVAIANIAGALGSNLLFFRLPAIPLLFTLAAAAFSGALGGALGHACFVNLQKTGLLKKFVQSSHSEEKENNEQ